MMKIQLPNPIKRRNPAAAALANPAYRRKVIQSKKLYSRKNFRKEQS